MEKKYIAIIVIAVLVVVASTAYSIISSYSENPISESECRSMEEVNRDACFCQLAMQKNDLSIVEEKVSDKYRKECYSAIAIETQNRSLCEKAGEFNRYCLENA